MKQNKLNKVNKNLGKFQKLYIRTVNQKNINTIKLKLMYIIQMYFEQNTILTYHGLYGMINYNIVQGTWGNFSFTVIGIIFIVILKRLNVISLYYNL